MTHYLAGE